MTNVFKLIMPHFVGEATDELSAAGGQADLLRYGGLIVLSTLLQGVFLFTQRRLLINMSRHIEYDLRNDFYAHLQKLPFEFYQTHRTGDLMARATNDLSAVRMIVGPALMYSMNTVFAMALLVPLMISVSWRLTLLAFLSMPLVASATHYFSRRIHDRFEQVQEYFGTVSNRAQESLAGVRVIRAYTQEQAEIEELQSGESRIRQSQHEADSAFGNLSSDIAVLHRSGFHRGPLVWRQPRHPRESSAGHGNHHRPVRAVQSVSGLSGVADDSARLGDKYIPARHGFDEAHEPDNVYGACDHATLIETRDVREIAGEIEFRNLTFTYTGAATPSLENVNLRINPGQTVAFVGAVGSGKSTLMNLVTRLLDAEPGRGVD